MLIRKSYLYWLVFVASFAAFGCKGKGDATQEEQHAQKEPSKEDAPRPQDTTDSSKSLKWKITERQRIETPGYVFGVAVRGGEGLAGTRGGEGQGGLYWVGPEGLKGSILGGGGGWPVAMDEGFGVLGAEGAVRVVKGGVVAEVWKAGVGMIGGFVRAGDRWWVLDREGALGGFGLVGLVDGSVVERVETGIGSPLALLKVGDKDNERLMVLMSGETGSVVIVEMGAGSRKVRREPLGAGVPLGVVEGAGGAAYLMKHMSQDLTVLDSQTGVTLGVIALGAVPSEVVVSEDKTQLWVLSGQGSLLRVGLEDGGVSGQVLARASLDPGSSQMAVWEGERGGILLLDRHGRALRWLDAQTLEERARLPLLGTVGRMAVERETRQVLVSLPELEQVVWASVEWEMTQ